MAGMNGGSFLLKRFFFVMALSILFAGQGQATIGSPALEKFLMPGGTSFDRFGRSVAVDGDTAIIGAPYDHTSAGSDAGSAYVFVRTGGVWEKQAELIPNNPAAYDNFGFSVALDGDTAVIGAYGADFSIGSAYVFVRSGGEWTQEAKLTPSNGGEDDCFGASVAVAGDTVVVGAYQHNELGNNSGSAYVFVRSDGEWRQEQELFPADGEEGDIFGYSVAVDGDTIVIGAMYNSPSDLRYAGSVYIFTRTDSEWNQEGKLLEPAGSSYNNFGASVSLDGDTALIGTSHNIFTSMGAAYIFTRSGMDWDQGRKLTPTDGVIGDSFGISVSLDADTAVIGAWYADNEALGTIDSGAAYIFTRDTNTGDWLEKAKLVAPDGSDNQNFGHRVAVSGNTALVGASQDSELGTKAGAAYLFGPPCGWGRTLPAGRWQMTAPPCTADPNTVIDQLADDIGTEANYDVRWISFAFDPVVQDYDQQVEDDPFSLGAGNWNFSYDGGFITFEGTSTPVEDCTAPYGLTGNCFVIPLEIASGSDRWNMVGHPLPYAVAWDQVRIAVYDENGSWALYTPTEANDADIVEKNLYRWTGSSYETWDDVEPLLGTLQPQESIWVRSLPGSGAYSELKLLIPAQ